MRTALLKWGYLKKYRSTISILSILSLILVASSCHKDRLQFDKIAGGKWSPEFAVPIAFGNLTMGDIIEGSEKTWKEYPDGFLSVIYGKDRVSSIGDEVIKIPDQNNDTTITIILPPGLPVGDSIAINLSFDAEFDGSGSSERIDSILFKGGFMEYEISTDLNHDSYIELRIPKLTKAGVPFYKKITFDYSGGSSNTKTISIPLKDYYLVLTSGGSGQPNFIHQEIKLSATALNNPNNSPYDYTIKQTITDLSYYLVMGYFHQHNIDIDKTEVVIDLFDNQMAGALFAEDPSLKITLRNSYGLPADLTFTELYAVRDGVKLNFTGALLPTLSIGHPTFNDIGQVVTTEFLFNTSNSNIKDIIELNPEKFFFEGLVQTNPQGSGIDNFALDTSSIDVDLEFELPLHGRALNFVLRDTTFLSGNEEGVDSKGVETLTLRVKTENRFPIDVNLQVYMTDSLNNIIDSVFDAGGKLLDAAPVSGPPDYHVTSSVDNITYITLTEDQLDSYKKAQKLIIEAHSSTTNAGTDIIKIYTDNAVRFEISAKAKYTNDF
ncbi:MAG: hypothetical protein KAG64_05345 [Bacteroidales bacterium]|nr:hypothetical protein [Bacteroidales bacterium]